MIARRVVLPGIVMMVVCSSAWSATVTISPASLPIGGGVFVVGQTTPTQQLHAVGAGPSDSLEWVAVQRHPSAGALFRPRQSRHPTGHAHVSRFLHVHGDAD